MNTNQQTKTQIRLPKQIGRNPKTSRMRQEHLKSFKHRRLFIKHKQFQSECYQENTSNFKQKASNFKQKAVHMFDSVSRFVLLSVSGAQTKGRANQPRQEKSRSHRLLRRRLRLGGAGGLGLRLRGRLPTGLPTSPMVIARN